MQAQLEYALSDRALRAYPREPGENRGENSLDSLQDEVLPYFNQHNALTFIKERTEGYQAGLQTVAEEKRDALSAYYADVTAYVQESRERMNLSPEPQIPEFPQLDTYLKGKVTEKDLDHDGSPGRVDVDDHDSLVQLTHHFDKRDGVESKTSIRERVGQAKSRKNHNQNEKQNGNQMEIS